MKTKTSLTNLVKMMRVLEKFHFRRLVIQMWRQMKDMPMITKSMKDNMILMELDLSIKINRLRWSEVEVILKKMYRAKMICMRLHAKLIMSILKWE